MALNGIAPIILIQFSKSIPGLDEVLAKIPLASDVVAKIGLPPIPIYLDEKLTGIVIDTELKSIEIDTKIDTATDGSTPAVNQKALGSTVTVTAWASQDSIGVTLLSALCDLILEKVTSQDYSISYLHGPIVLFNGLLHSLSFEPQQNDDRIRINLVLSRGGKNSTDGAKDPTAQVAKEEGTLPLSGGTNPGPASSTVPPPPPPPPPQPTFKLGLS